MGVDERLAKIEKLLAFDFHTFGHDETCPGCKKKWLVDELKRTREDVRKAHDHLTLKGSRYDPSDPDDGERRVRYHQQQAESILRKILDGGDQ